MTLLALVYFACHYARAQDYPRSEARASSVGADAVDGADGVMQSFWAVILIVRVPNRPSRPNTISIPSVPALRAEPHRRVVGVPPSVGAEFDAAPKLIRQIEVDQAVVLGEAERDLALRTIELGLRLERIEGCVDRGRARRIPGALVALLAQPGLKALAAQRPGFPVAVDDEIGKAGAVACVKEPGGRCDIEEDVRAAHGARPSSARPMATGSGRDSVVP